MNRARLIKQGAPPEQKHGDHQTGATKSATKAPLAVVKKWLTERRAVSQNEARQAFASLFT